MSYSGIVVGFAATLFAGGGEFAAVAGETAEGGGFALGGDGGA